MEDDGIEMVGGRAFGVVGSTQRLLAMGEMDKSGSNSTFWGGEGAEKCLGDGVKEEEAEKSEPRIREVLSGLEVLGTEFMNVSSPRIYRI